jgi:hypothetical protein
MVKNRPGSAKSAMGRQEADFRRGAPGKKFIGETAEQARGAVDAQRKKVHRMAEIASARKVAEELGMPISAILAELVQDSLRLARTLSLTPFRLAQALWRRPREV